MPSANKVQFGLKNVHYALLTESDSSAPSFGTPVAVKGAVNLELSQEGAESVFYADNQAYYRISSDNGYTGSVEMAKIPDAMLKDVWGFGYDSTNKVLFEDANAEAKPFALLFQIDGDQNDDYYVFYRCYAGRPNIGSTTTTEAGKEPQTQTFDIVCYPLIDNSSSGTLNGKVYAKTDENTTTTVKSGWFTTVFTDFTVPTPPSP